MTNVRGATLLITGANGGLGREFVAQALDRGAARVYAAARRPWERPWRDARVVPLLLDVTDADSIRIAAETADDVDILVNNAGIHDPGLLTEEPLDEVRRLYETNVFAPIALATAFAPRLAAGGRGAIVNVASALSWLARPGGYASSKAALWHASNTMRLELAPRGVHVLTAHLGYTDTPMTAGLDVPKGRPEDVVAAIYDGLETGALEVLADAASRQVKQLLSAPVDELYPDLAAS